MSKRLNPDVIGRHRAENRDQLVVWWKDLFPEFQSPAQGPPRRFQGEALNERAAGWVFEHWIHEAFRLDQEAGKLSVEGPFSVPFRSNDQTKEQIDGLVTLGWQGFVIECKLSNRPTSFAPIAVLHLQAEMRPLTTMGLFFSREYSVAAIELASRLSPIRVLLFRTKEIDWALNESLDMVELIRRKWHGAVKYGAASYVLGPVLE